MKEFSNYSDLFDDVELKNVKECMICKEHMDYFDILTHIVEHGLTFYKTGWFVGQKQRIIR